MKDFTLRNDTRLLLRNEPVADIAEQTKGKRVLFVYGGGSVKKNGCYDDITKAVQQGGATLYELGGASRELEDIERGIALTKEHDIELIIGAGGASIMDCAKLIAFGVFHEADLWDYVKRRKNPYGERRLPLLLMPTYPSSGSEYGLGAVMADSRTGDFGTAYGIAADTALLVPRYALTLNEELTAYTGLVTLVQVCSATLGDRNPLSYNIGITVIHQVLDAARRLKETPQDLDARGVIAYAASISTSSRLGLGKGEKGDFAYDIYEVEFVPEVLFGVPYRKALTTVYPRFLAAMTKYHEDEIRRFVGDAFGLDVSTMESALVRMFSELGVDMYFEGDATLEDICRIDIDSLLSGKEILEIVRKCITNNK